MKMTNEEQREYDNLSDDGQTYYIWLEEHSKELTHKDIMDFLVGVSECILFKEMIE